MTFILLTQGILIGIVLLQGWQNRQLVKTMEFGALNALLLSDRLVASLSIAKVFMAYLSRAEDMDRACMVLTEEAVKDMHAAYYFALNGTPMTEDA